MDETPSTPFSDLSAPSSETFPLTWLIAGIIATTALSLAAAHAHPRVRLIGLFSLGFGLLIGWLLVQLAAKLDARPSRSLSGIVAAVLTFGGLAGSTWEAWRLDELRMAASAKDGLSQRVIDQIKARTSPGEPIAIDNSSVAAFRWHLSHRIRQLGRWSSPWPELFWLMELSVASAASVWISTRCQTASSTVTN